MSDVNMANTTEEFSNETTVVTETTTMGMEEIEAQMLLHKLNDEMALRYLPVIVYMLILMLVGIFGNILVCCVYCSKPKKTSSHYFILNLAVLDLLTCVIGMPTEVTDLRYPYMFYAPAACKLLRFVESVSIIGSSITLIAVAFDRYYRICKLGRQISVKKSQIICVIAVIIGILSSWPACLLFGEKTIDLGIPGVKGVDCSTDDSVRHTIYPTLYYGFLFLLFILCLVFFTVIYAKIGAVIWRRKKTRIGEPISSSPNGHALKDSNTPSDQISSDPISTEMSSDHEAYNEKRASSDSKQAFGKRLSRNNVRVTRTTVVLFAVTVAYVISFLPFLIVMVVRSVVKNFEENLNTEEEVVYKFCSKSYFINNAINPVIYSFLNINFRKDIKVIFKKCCSTCCGCRN
ncbi:orexin receptor type 2-like [Ostrea edulis]|uniref:orexin receptor type 2-like n=1 Tax=Ostrea edulis TaxID=37623 RepID=UPI0024AFB21F|nr:orexin receptor type 2-like [Ostrea edulis]XP_048752307.2 orexin receptor type 2-like [Ostrea edulis]XP_048752308.2 orexin receptor type 2-like [Ostrea edulis]XP_048752309.2 orexin receptor type 2-like [Ostrea edulis]XP_056017938.1 orexin receptor type 2-like [Ostrea edulis]